MDTWEIVAKWIHAESPEPISDIEEILRKAYSEEELKETFKVALITGTGYPEE